MRRWLRNFLRQRMKPIPAPYAVMMKRRLSAVYLFMVWNAIGLGTYMMVKDSFPETKQEQKQPGRYYARLLQAEDVHVIRVEGLKVTNEYEVTGVPKLMPEPEEFRDEENDSPKDQEILSD